VLATRSYDEYILHSCFRFRFRFYGVLAMVKIKTVRKVKLWAIKQRIERAGKDNVFSTFGKGDERSIALNFGKSSGSNCSTFCRHHKNSTADNPTHACYSSTAELMRPTVGQFLLGQEASGALQTIGNAMIQLGELLELLRSKNEKLSFFRISAAGSVPNRDQIPERDRKRFETLFRQLIQVIVSHGAKVHFPVETMEKKSYYDSFLGDLITVRLSCQSIESFMTSAESSFVVGESITNKTSKTVKRDRIELGRQIAVERYRITGRKTIVCPAIVSTFEKRDRKIQCGDCDACSRKNLDIIYPLHV
jgi:hypothetical protein